MADVSESVKLIRQFLNTVNKLQKDSGLPPEVLAYFASSSGLVDTVWYENKYKDVAWSGVPAALHYVTHGYKEGRYPCSAMDGFQLPPVSDDFLVFIGHLKKKCEVVSGVSKEEISVINTTDAQSVCNKPTMIGSTASFCKEETDNGAGVLVSRLPSNAGESSVIRQGSYGTLYDMPMYVQWGVTNMCNYNCSYCFGHEPLDKKKFPSIESIVNVIENIASLNRPFYSFHLDGGEPTVYPQFAELLYLLMAKFSNRINVIRIVSNGSRNEAVYSVLKSISQRVPVELVISVHTEFADINHIYDLVKNLSPHIKLSLSLMFHPDKISLLEDMVNVLINLRRKLYFNFWLTFLREPPRFDVRDSRYSKYHYEWENRQREKIVKARTQFSDSPTFIRPMLRDDLFCDMLTNGQFKHCSHDNITNKLRGLWCVAGTHLLHIDGLCRARGLNCRECTCQINLYKPNVIKDCSFMEIVKCSMNSCGCSNNYPAMKFRDRSEAEMYLKSVKCRQERLF